MFPLITILDREEKRHSLKGNIKASKIVSPSPLLVLETTDNFLNDTTYVVTLREWQTSCLKLLSNSVQEYSEPSYWLALRTRHMIGWKAGKRISCIDRQAGQALGLSSFYLDRKSG